MNIPRIIQSLFAAVLLLACAPALATVRETVTFNNANSNGALNSSANDVRTTTLTGGYTLGRLDLSGSLTSRDINTFASDAQILITGPGGVTFTFHPFDGIGLFTTQSFSRSIFIPGIGDPAGGWSFRFYEVVDNGGTTHVDSTWNITINFTDNPPVPPASAALGSITQPGASVPQFGILAAGYAWYSFTLPRAVLPQLGRYLDISLASTTASPDSQMALFNSAGTLIAADDDSGPGFLSQLSFGAGTRPPNGDGAPFEGQNGMLDAGTYYLAVGKYQLQFSGQPWDVVFQGLDPLMYPLSISIQINTNLQPGTDCFAPTVTQQPAGATASPGQTVQFSAASTGTGTPAYHWRHLNVPLSDNAFISGSATPTLTLNSVRPIDGGAYDVMITNSCGSTRTDAALLTVTCAADFNGDGDVGTDQDIDAFFACLGGNCCPTCGSSDFNGDGDVGTDADIDSFFRVLGGGPC